MLLSILFPASKVWPAFTDYDASEISQLSPKALFKTIVEYYQDKVLSVQKYEQLWITLALNYLGITNEHISRTLDLRRTRVDSFLEFFSFAFMYGPESLIRMAGTMLQEVVYEKYLNNSEKAMRQHQAIGLILLREKDITTPLVIFLFLILQHQ